MIFLFLDKEMKFLLMSMVMGMVLLRADGGSSWRDKEENVEMMNTIPEGLLSLMKMLKGFLVEDVAGAFAFAGVYIEPSNDVNNDGNCGDPDVSGSEEEKDSDVLDDAEEGTDYYVY